MESFIHKIKNLLKSKYNGSKVVLKKNNQNAIEIKIMIPEQYQNQTQNMKQEILTQTNLEFIEIIPMIEV